MKYNLEYDNLGNMLISDKANRLGFVITRERLERGIEANVLADLLRTLNEQVDKLTNA